MRPKADVIYGTPTGALCVLTELGKYADEASFKYIDPVTRKRIHKVWCPITKQQTYAPGFRLSAGNFKILKEIVL